jgi:hypothetical protein
VAIDTSLIECIVVAVPDTRSVASVSAALAELAENAAIRILDLVAVTRSPGSGETIVLEIEDLDGAPARALVEENVGVLLSDNDIALASAALLPGSAGIIVVVEDRWAQTLSSAAQRAGGRVIGGGRIPQSRIEAAMEEPPSKVATGGGQASEDDDTGRT